MPSLSKEDLEDTVSMIQGNINSNIRYIRAVNGLTIRQLSVITGVSTHSIGKLERKKYVNVPIRALLKICFFFNLSFTDIFLKDVRKLDTERVLLI